MIADIVSTIIAICLVGFAVLDVGALEEHKLFLVLAGIALAALGVGANRADYLKWPGVATLIAGIAVIVLAVSGFAALSSESIFWGTFWAGTVAGIVSLWSALYRGPAASSADDTQQEPRTS